MIRPLVCGWEMVNNMNTWERGGGGGILSMEQLVVAPNSVESGSKNALAPS